MQRLTAKHLIEFQESNGRGAGVTVAAIRVKDTTRKPTESTNVGSYRSTETGQITRVVPVSPP